MVSPAGFEPATYSLEGYCSIQLSYKDRTAPKLPLKRLTVNDTSLASDVSTKVAITVQCTPLHPRSELGQILGGDFI
jgi:hypothetical protein